MFKKIYKRYKTIGASIKYTALASILTFAVIGSLSIFANHQKKCGKVECLTEFTSNNHYLGQKASSNNLQTKGFLYLTNDDVQAYKTIFKVQKSGDWETADRLIKGIQNSVLMGHVQYQRYMHPKKYRSSYKELNSWLSQYSDHPDAARVYKLAINRKGDRAAPQKPIKKYGIRGNLDPSNISSKKFTHAANYSSAKKNLIAKLVRDVRKHIQKGQVTYALNKIQEDQNRVLLNQIEFDTLRGEIASGYFHFGELEKALDLAMTATEKSGRNVPLANWIAGLSAWKLNELTTAAFHFEQAAESDTASPWTASASAYWAARIHTKKGKKHKAKKWLEKASQYDRTFYGLIANSALRKQVSFQWQSPNLTIDKTQALKSIKAGQRALALLDIGQKALAQRELSRIHPNGNRTLEKALIAVANQHGMPGLAMRVASAVKTPDGQLYDAALYPVAPWQTDHSHGVDNALVNAFIRQESRFDPYAQNGRSGASGLMQLMPRTASFLHQNVNYSKSNSYLLLDPKTNISLGRKYISHLLGQRRIGGNLFLLATAYNAGPGNLAKWQSKIDYANDPLYFIESIPVAETRAFVERVMTNYWIYRIRMGQPVPTLDMIAKDQWPIYNPLDDHDMQLASIQ